MTIEKIILKDTKFNNIIKDNPVNEEYISMPNFNCKKEHELPNIGAYNKEMFEVFYYNKYFNELCLILIKYNNEVCIVRINDNKTLLTINLKEIKIVNQKISILKHYLIDKKDYLIIAINDSNIFSINDMIIYDLNINQIKYIVKIFNFNVDKVLLINDNLNHINSSLEHFGLNEGKQNKVYDFNNEKFISNIKTTENDICYNNIHWKNDFIIKCCKTYIKIINFKTSELYGQFNNNFKILNDILIIKIIY